MRQRLMSILIVIALPLSLFLPVCAQASVPAVAQPPAALQGELAYVLDGNIWLLDLVTHKAQQLTKDGDNRWPNWSTDGRYLFYTHSKSEEQSDLYILDMEMGTVPMQLARDACCAAWESKANRIAYIALADTELALKGIRPDGTNVETLVTPLTYGRSSWPTGNLQWVDDGPREKGWAVPLEVIVSSVKNTLSTYDDMFLLLLSLSDNPLRPLLNIDEINGCLWRNLRMGGRPGTDSLFAVSFEGSATDCQPKGLKTKLRANKSIILGNLGPSEEIRELPWLAYPAWSLDVTYLVAERYTEATDPAQAKLQGLVLYNVEDQSETALAAGGAQPAWRPAPPVDPAVARFVQPGERVVTLEPALTWQGATYRVHALTKGEARLITPAIFTAPNGEALTKRGITALIVTKDGQVVNDAATLRQVFLLYTAAYLLYEQPPVEVDPKIGDELGKVLDNPIFQGVAVSELWKTRRAQTTEALRTLLTDQVSAKTTLDPLLEQAFATTPKQVETALDAFGAAVDNKAASDAVLLALKPDLAAAYQAASDTAKGRKIELQFLRFAARLLFISHLQEERATWLAIYADAFPNGTGALDRDQIRAAATVMEETKKSSTQRVNIAGDFLLELGVDQLLNLTGVAANKAATALVTHVSEKAGAEIAANAVAGVLSSAAFGVALGNLLYGSDELYADFMLARRADELRATFRSGRTTVQTNAAAAKQQAQDKLVYNGDLAAQFRAAYLLETLAAVQAQRAYADGVAATFRLPNGVELLNWLRGEDWRKAVDGLQQGANEIESNVLNQVSAPAYLETATELALSRIQKAASDPNNNVLAKVGGDIIVTSDFWKRVYLTQSQLQNQLARIQDLEKQFGGQGFFTQQISQLQATLGSPFALGMQVLNDMIEEKVVAQQAAKREIAVSSKEVDDRLLEEIAASRGAVTSPQATAQAAAQAALEATATAVSWTPTPVPTVDTSLKASVTPLPTIEALPTRSILTDVGYTEGLMSLEENLKKVANMSIGEYREVIHAGLLADKLSKVIGEEKVSSTEEELHARHILVRVITLTPPLAATSAAGTPTPTPPPAPRTEAQALALVKQLREQIVKGEKFEDVAAKYSEDTSNAQKGGDLGWFGHGAMVKSFEDAAFALKVGEISQPITTTFGVHLIQVLEKDPKHKLEDQTLTQKRTKAYQDWLQEQISATKIERPDDLSSKLPPLSK